MPRGARARGYPRGARMHGAWFVFYLPNNYPYMSRVVNWSG